MKNEIFASFRENLGIAVIHQTTIGNVHKCLVLLYGAIRERKALFQNEGIVMRYRTVADLKIFTIDPKRGFLPNVDPLRKLPNKFMPWEEVATELPKLLAQGTARRVFDRLPILDPSGLPHDALHNERAMLLLSYFGHAYIWGNETPVRRIPACIAKPWQAIGCERLDRPPILSYASYALHNWRRLNSKGPVRLGNLALLQNFLGGIDEEWFILVHVEIEAKAGPIFPAIVNAQKAVIEKRAEDLAASLSVIVQALTDILRTLQRMPERCDPYIYYHRVRPYIHGWKDNPALPRGIIYEGVKPYQNQPQFFRGETGAQSTIIPTLDAFLGITFKDENDRGEKDVLLPYLREMIAYMPYGHRAFLAAIKNGPSTRTFVVANRSSTAALVERYNTLIELLAQFRLQHFGYAGQYINAQSRKAKGNPTDVGTGGTPFMVYLKKHYDETLAHIIS